MNRTAIKNFAVWVRKSLCDGVASMKLLDMVLESASTFR